MMADPSSGSSPLLVALAERRKESGIALLLAAAALGFGAIQAFLAKEYLVGGFLLVLTVIGVGAGLWQLYFVPVEMTGAESARMFVVIVGGVAGFVLALMGVALAIKWRADILMWLQPGGPDKTVTAEERWKTGMHVLYALAVLLGGLGIMLVTLQLGRVDERANANLRRLVYGYNAALAGFLLLLILTTVNVFVAVRFTKPLDFTASSLFTLSDRAQNVLRNLERPVKVYVLLDERELRRMPGVDAQIRTMLTNCQDFSDRFEWEELTSTDQVKVATLKQKYPNLSAGLLVEYETASNAKDYQLIRQDDLAGQDMDPITQQGSRQLAFKGEDALMSALNYATEGKRPIIYFTQGHGELDIAARTRDGGAILADLLGKRNFDVKPLKFEGKTVEVPSDATVVIVAGPKVAFSERAVKALEGYMARRGKMMLMLDTQTANENTYLRTGLEPMLQRFNLDLPNERLYCIPTQEQPNHELIIAAPNPSQEGNPLVAPFKGKSLIMENVRPVRPGSKLPPMAVAQFRAETLLINSPLQLSILEPKAEPSLRELSMVMRKMQIDPEEMEQRVTAARNTSVAVAVLQSSGMSPHGGGGDETPRLVVFGSSHFANNGLFAIGADRINFNFVASSLDWLRGKNNNIGIESKKVASYQLPPDKVASPYAFVLLPTAIILLGVIGTGSTVWLVRRR